MIGEYFVALGLTLAVELPVFALVAPRGQMARIVSVAFAANLVSHPIAWWLISAMGAPFLLTEFGVVVFEAVALWFCAALDWRRAVLGAAIANVVTASLSFVI